MKGKIYKIYNPTNKNTYIGSTIQSYPKKRLYRHKQTAQTCPRYGCLFDDEVDFKVICECEINNQDELRELEQVFIKIAEQSDEICVNKNMSYVPEHLKKIRIRQQKNKYNKSEKGKHHRKWQNYRHKCRNKINTEIKLYFNKINANQQGEV
jgi:hypothetical protein|tara:strand:+ start:856 stop:1311 length:456 start_codon:yes stop_codon:yes gene_type:complete